jgi:hypothetical protein
MTKTTIYLAKITKSKDYGADLVLDLEAFSTLEKAEAFMLSSGMMKNSWGGWKKPDNYDYDGTIDALEVK